MDRCSRYVDRCLTGRSGLDSLLERSNLDALDVWDLLHTLQVDQVWVRTVPGQVGQVSQWVGWQHDAGVGSGSSFGGSGKLWMR